MREGWKNGEVILPYGENQLRFKLSLSISLIFYSIDRARVGGMMGTIGVLNIVEECYFWI